MPESPGFLFSSLSNNSSNLVKLSSSWIIFEIVVQTIGRSWRAAKASALRRDCSASFRDSSTELDNAIKASEILFGNSTGDDLKKLNEKTFLDVFDGVPLTEIPQADIESGLDIIAALAEKGGFLKSNGEARRALKENSISVNKIKVSENTVVSNKDLINNKYLLLQRGRKNYYLVIVK